MTPTGEPIAKPASNDARPKEAAPGVEALVVAWCVWLLGSWVVALGPQWLSLVPGIRYMGVAAVIGSMLLWPALRLSQALPSGWERKGWPGVLPLVWVLLDWLGLNLVWFGVTLTMVAMRQWTMQESLWSSAALTAWTMLTGMLILWGWGGSVRRVLAMMLCVALVFGPALANVWAANGGPAAAGTWKGPLATLWALAHLHGPEADWDWGRSLIGIGAAGAAALLLTVLAVVTGLFARGGSCGVNAEASPQRGVKAES